jgi:hypothetical protein
MVFWAHSLHGLLEMFVFVEDEVEDFDLATVGTVVAERLETVVVDDFTLDMGFRLEAERRL